MASRKQTIMRRAQMYAAGELSLEDFMLLEQVDLEAEELEQAEKPAVTLTELDEKRRAEQAKAEKAAAAKQSKVIEGKYHLLTYKDWQALTLNEQNKLYKEHTERVSRLIRGEVDSITYKDEPEVIPRYTVEQWKQMSLAEMQELYDKDEAQALELMEASRAV